MIRIIEHIERSPSSTRSEASISRRAAAPLERPPKALLDASKDSLPSCEGGVYFPPSQAQIRCWRYSDDCTTEQVDG